MDTSPQDYFESRWKEYLKKKNLLDGTKNPKPDNLKVDERDTFYKKLSFCGFGGASGHDAPMIAYFYNLERTGKSCVRGPCSMGQTGIIPV